MFKHYIFYNPLAGGEEAVARIEEFASRYEGALLYDVTKGGGYRGICEFREATARLTDFSTRCAALISLATFITTHQERVTILCAR